jgi:hypothetical protein
VADRALLDLYVKNLFCTMDKETFTLDICKTITDRTKPAPSFQLKTNASVNQTEKLHCKELLAVYVLTFFVMSTLSPARMNYLYFIKVLQKDMYCLLDH